MSTTNQELADFLRRARANVDPSSVRLPVDARARRVPGLRREEVAFLAGVSTDYYTRLEQGRRIMPSVSVVNAIAQALDLDLAGRAHLNDLLTATNSCTTPADPIAPEVREGLLLLMNSHASQPAFILGPRSDVLASNQVARALLTDFDRLPPADRNYTRWILLSEDARNLFVDWELHAREAVESLRLDAATYSHDPVTWHLIKDLKQHSTEFFQWWEEHRVHQRTFGAQHLRHPVVGDLVVNYETLTLPGDPDLRLFVYTTQPDTPSRKALEILADTTLDRPGTTSSP